VWCLYKETAKGIMRTPNTTIPMIQKYEMGHRLFFIQQMNFDSMIPRATRVNEQNM
jgi:hypothetical protein